MASTTFAFCLITLFIFWVAGLPDKAAKKKLEADGIMGGKLALAGEKD